MARRLQRTTKGEYFTEGARRLWLVLLKRELSQAEAAAEIGTAGATLCRWLYGERRPTLEWVFKMEKAFKVPARCWSEPPTADFQFPAEQRADTDAA